MRKGILRGALAALLLLMVSGTSWAAGGMIIQSVLDGVPNTGTDHVVLGELFSRDG